MKIKLNFTLRNLDGSEITLPDGSPAVISSLIANLLMNNAANSKDVIKHFNWATELYNTGEIDLDRAGQKEFKDFIYEIQNLSTLIKGTILCLLEKKDSNVSSE
jgi:hypothetical protein